MRHITLRKFTYAFLFIFLNGFAITSHNNLDNNDPKNGNHKKTMSTKSVASRNAAPTPVIQVLGNGVAIGDNDFTPATADFTDFGNTSSRTFYVDNTSNGRLDISSLTLTNTTDFTISSPLTNVSIRGQDAPAPFTITLNSFTCGSTYQTDVRIASDATNDADGVWIFRLSATVNPEADIVDISLAPISDFSTDSPSVTNSTDFGNIGVGGSSTATTFIVQNNGTCNLILSPLPLVALSNNIDFTLNTTGTANSIGPGASTSFTITFNPITIGTKSSTVTITNNDADEPNYTFTVQGVGTPPLPDINVQGNSTNIVSGQTITSTTDHTDFGNVNSGSFFDRTYTIQNTGSFALNITNPVSTLTGSDFVILTQPTTPIAPGASSTFIVRYTPSSSGVFTDTVNIPNDDPDASESPYTFDVSGTSYLIEQGGLWSYLDDGSDQGTVWQTADVSPTGANWATGNAQLGYGDGDEVTVVGFIDTDAGTSGTQKNATTYFRRSFTASATDVSNTTLNINAVRDDGMVVYINGTEVWRDNMPVGTILYNTWASSVTANENGWVSLNVANIVTLGSNEIAVEVHQESDSSSDISFDFFMYTSNDYIFIPPTKPDNDLDGIADYKDSDDDNDGLTDQLEGCHSGQLEDLNSDPYGAGNEESLLSDFPFSQTLDDGNTIDYSYTGTFTAITSYDAGDHGWSIRTKGPSTSGTLTLDFGTPVDNLTFRLVDFDEDETYTVNAYDDSNNLIDLITNVNIYYLGSYISQSGNTVTDVTNGTSTNNDGEAIGSDQYGTAYFYFPNIRVSKIDFIVDQPDGSTIRIAGIEYCNLDTDGDTVEDYHDSDSDNDGIPDLVESGGTDIDGNGIVDDLTDTDEDGIADILDVDSANYNTYERTKLETYIDFDKDGIINSRDLDSDNDGITDIIEIGEPDVNGDGQIDGFTDANLDGYHDSYDGASSRLITGADTGLDGFPDTYPNANLDGTGYPNFMDIDSDDDGITDNTEAQSTTLYIAYTYTDTDTDGILNIFDNSSSFGGNGLLPVDTDYDGIPDYLDTDSDDHEENDIIEGHDTNGDGVVNGSDSPNADTGLFTGTDSDRDGLDDGFDNDDSSPEATNNTLQPNSHAFADGGYDRDWRATTSSIDFDGINDYIDIGDNHDMPTDFSIEAWILQQATTTSGTILSKRDTKSGAGNKRGYHLSMNSNYLNLTWYDNAGAEKINITSPHDITNNKWYHVAATFDGTTAIIYIDGVEVNRDTPDSGPANTSAKFLIGAMYDSDTPNTPKNHFNGYIDEVRLWTVALSTQQLREMMNQEIEQNSTAVRGKVIPKDISGGLLWANLKGYYPMTSDTSEDRSNNIFHGNPKNITTTELQTAPLPYTTIRNGEWKNSTASTPWTYGNSVWNLPNSISVDGSTEVNWNIVQTDHNVEIDTYGSLGRERHVLGLIVNANTLTVNGTTNKATSTYKGNGLNVSWYLELNGKIDLEGESQLIQSKNSDLSVGVSGVLERDQQGTKDLFTYNYWSSPVGFTSTINPLHPLNPNNYSYTLNNNIFRDGTNSATPANISFVGGYDGSVGPPISIANYWIWKYGNLPSDTYSAWQHVRNTGTIKAGEGFTMKGIANTAGNLALEQNYVYQGKPNNGDISLDLSINNDYLVGNPYASAIDADQFILDNGPVIDYTDPGGLPETDPLISGTLYFWEHWGGGSHVLAEYQGGYGTYNLSGGTPAAAWGTPDPDVAQTGTGTKVPGRYIAVGQGFFVTGESTGTIKFNNNQRVFQKEGSSSSVYIRQATTENNTDSRMKIRLGFNSVNTIHRQLLLTEDSRATLGIDWGFDGLQYQNQMDDMYWLLEDEKYTIQGIDSFSESTIIPIGVHTIDAGLNNIIIDILENIPNDLQIYLHDKALDIYHNLRNNKYEIYLEAGEYLDRFELTFSNQSLSVEGNELLNELQAAYINSSESIMIQNPKMINIKSAELLNTIGQSIYQFDDIKTELITEIKTNKLSVGTYIIKLQTEIGVINKKVLVN